MIARLHLLLDQTVKLIPLLLKHATELVFGVSQGTLASTTCWVLLMEGVILSVDSHRLATPQYGLP